MTTEEIKALVVEYANRYGIDPAIALAQIKQESGYNPMAVSAVGARGLAQFMPGTWPGYGQGSFDNAFVPEFALDAWGRLMSELRGKYGDDYRTILMEYHGGPNRSIWGPKTRGYADLILSRAGTGAAGGPFAGAVAGAYGEDPWSVTAGDTNPFVGARATAGPQSDSNLWLYLALGGVALITLFAFNRDD